MPRVTTPAPLHSGQAVLIWAAIALRMKALLLGSLLRKSDSSSSTVKATTAVLCVLRGVLRGMITSLPVWRCSSSSLSPPRVYRKRGQCGSERGHIDRQADAHEEPGESLGEVFAVRWE